MRHEAFFEKGEKILLLLHRHPFVFLPSMLALVVMAVVPFLVIAVASLLVKSLSPDAWAWVWAGFGLYYLFWMMTGLLLWIDYYYDVYLISDTHILDVDQTGLLLRRISHTSLMRVQDVTTRMSGFWGNMYNFGEVDVQTAGHVEDIKLEDVHEPAKVASTIMRLHDELVKREGRQQEMGLGEGVHPPTN